jgi:glycosyltransferase involved in cell wall biosynthesis
VKVLVVDPSLFTLPYDAAFCTALADAGAEVTLVGRPLRAEERLPAAGFAHLPLFYARSERPGGAGRWRKGLEHGLGLRALAALVRRAKPDVVHLQWLVLPLLDAMGYATIGRRVPIVLTAHNTVPFHGAGAALQRLGHDRALRGFAHYVTHTGPTAQHLVALGIPAERVTVLPHPPLSLSAVPPAGPRPPGPLRILLFGALKPYKGVDVLVAAGLELARRGRDCHITIAGRPFMDLAPLEAAVAAAGARERFTFDARFLPDVELAAHLAAADILVFPYREIDASGALALAAGRGRPIVASAVGVFAERPVAEHLLLVPPGDAQALADALERLILTPEERALRGQLALRLATALPGWPTFAARCLEIYAGLRRG